MRLKIKWNDDRVRGAITAILLITRARLRNGATEDLIQAALADYRDDPDGYKANKATWADAREISPLTKSSQVTYYKNLLIAIDALTIKIAKQKMQFNSLLELDNWLIASLKNVL